MKNVDISTDEFAKINLVKPQSVHARYCRFGSYFGVIPRKLPNGRLAWPLPGSGNDSKEVSA